MWLPLRLKKTVRLCEQNWVKRKELAHTWEDASQVLLPVLEKTLGQPNLEYVEVLFATEAPD